MAADPVTVMAGGIRFYLIGQTAMPAGGVVHKFQNAMIAARQKVAGAYAALSTPGAFTQRQQLVLEYCFNPTNAQTAATLTTVRAVLEATLAGLRTDGLSIREPDPASMPPQAEGYVTRVGPFSGDIHTVFTLSQARTTHNLIHEATHKFRATEDRSYIANNLAPWLTVRLQNIPGNSPITNANALVNADSFAALAMEFT
jgi:hypothetical protein